MGQSPDPDFFALLFHLLDERAQGPASAWWPYLRLLPEMAEIRPPLAYGSGELALLAGSAAQVWHFVTRLVVHRHAQ